MPARSETPFDRVYGSDPPVHKLLPHVTFTVPGLPAPQGSKTPMITPGTDKVYLKESSPNLPAWRDLVMLFAKRAWKRQPLLKDVPVFVRIEFILKRPAGLKGKPTPPAIKRVGDLDKLERAVYDGITGAIISDDCIVIENSNKKRIAEPGEPTGAIITVREMTWPTAR